MKLHELRESRAQTVAKMRALTDKAEAEKRDLTEDESTKFDEHKAAVRALDGKIERAQFLADAERSAPAIIHHNGDGKFEDRARDFSLVRAINGKLDGADDGFEREISSEVARRSGRKFQGIAVPDEYFTRTLTVAGDAASLYPTTLHGSRFIDLLRSQLVVGRLGATVLDNLVGDNDIPKQTASSTAQWVAEDGEITATDADFDDVSLTPKTVGAITSYSRRTLINAVPSIEDIVRRDLASVVANAIDLQALIGDGGGNRPTGVVNAAGVHELSLAGPTWAEVLAFIAEVQGADADIGSMGWTMTPAAVAKFRSTPKVTNGSGAQDTFLMAEPGNLAGYTAIPTTALPQPTAGEPAVTSSTVIFGAWSQLLIGYWSGTDILVNPYETAAYSRGRVLVRVMRDVDVAVRHGESFAYADDLVVAEAE